jgi:type II secretory pathway component GspD/PulD (secretin)
MVRATSQELDIVQQAVEVLNEAPPQITIEAKFVEIGQDDSKELGFDWFLGNTTMQRRSNRRSRRHRSFLRGAPTTGQSFGRVPRLAGDPNIRPARD